MLGTLVRFQPASNNLLVQITTLPLSNIYILRQGLIAQLGWTGTPYVDQVGLGEICLLLPPEGYNEKHGLPLPASFSTLQHRSTNHRTDLPSSCHVPPSPPTFPSGGRIADLSIRIDFSSHCYPTLQAFPPSV